MMKLFKKFCFVLVCATGISFFVVGCASQAPAPVQQQVSIAQTPPPPVPPSNEELEKPPNIVLEKPSRDPFVPIPIAGQSGVATNASAETKGGKGHKSVNVEPASYVLSGVLVDNDSSAIIQTGMSTYIVHQGEKLNGYRVASITTKGVVLVGKGGKLSLPLLSNQ